LRPTECSRTACAARAPFHQTDDLVTLFWLDAAELILDVNTVLAAQVEQILALQVQFSRQSVKTDLLFLLLQAELPVASRSTLPDGYTQCAASFIIHSNGTAQQEKGISPA
jgi:hypothetical protein